MRTAFLGLMLLLASGAVWAQANSIPSQPHLLVKGEASRTVQPDRFGVELLLQSTDMSPGTARAAVQANAEKMLALFARFHAVEGSVNAATLTIAPETRYEDDREVFKGTKVTRRLRATFGSLADLQGLLGQLQTSTDLQVVRLRPAYSEAGRLRGELKRQAAEQSRATATNLARAYNTKIIGLYTISDVAPEFAYGVRAGTWGMDGDSAGSEETSDSLAPPKILSSLSVAGSRASGEQLEAGSITYRENVYAIFLIAP